MEDNNKEKGVGGRQAVPNGRKIHGGKDTFIQDHFGITSREIAKDVVNLEKLVEWVVRCWSVFAQSVNAN